MVKAVGETLVRYVVSAPFLVLRLVIGSDCAEVSSLVAVLSTIFSLLEVVNELQHDIVEDADYSRESFQPKRKHPDGEDDILGERNGASSSGCNLAPSQSWRRGSRKIVDIGAATSPRSSGRSIRGDPSVSAVGPGSGAATVVNGSLTS